ncbi:TetR family transcriptional regulator [Halopseudomonas pachastrellae]|nr:TetR family transcriptional regulator [Halopseudomonas pachastrellae]
MSTPQHIVASALGLFYRNGFHASGVDLLSREAGVTKKTLYRHYPSKDVLIEAALALRHTQFMARLRAFVEQAAVEQRPLAYVDFIALGAGG